MVWGKVDDKLHSHRKRRRAGLEAMGLWVVAMSYSGDQLTDGLVDQEFVSGERRGAALAKRLVDAGFWHTSSDSVCPQGSERCLRPDGDGPGWWFHEWTERNPTRAKVTEDRTKNAAKLAKWRAEHEAKRETEQADQVASNPVTNLVTNRPVTRLRTDV